MESRRCAACDRVYQNRPQAPRQAYCTNVACQRERRKRWQRAKRLSDFDYVENQKRAQRAWCRRNPDYWREYRSRNDGHKGERQRTRGGSTRPKAAKMDSWISQDFIDAGIYRIVPVSVPKSAKKNSWIVEITRVSRPIKASRSRCKERTV